jgi:hypothetical protein
MKRSLFRPADATVIAEAHRCLNASEFEAALGIVNARLGQPFEGSPLECGLLRMALGATLIDIGGEGYIRDAVERGLNLLQSESVHLEKQEKHIDEAQFEYNMGNAKKSLFDIDRREQGPAFEYKPATIALLTEAKNHYWRSFKLLVDGGRKLRPELFVNLGNALDVSSRIPEALWWYGRAIAAYPDFSMAHLNRAHSLLWLDRLSRTTTITLLDQTRQGFERGAHDKNLPLHVQQDCAKWQGRIEQQLVSLGQTREMIAAHSTRTEEEARAHSQYRRFCIENHLCLSEHALYCPCAGARRDSLTIPVSTSGVGGRFVGRMEMLLNRLKAEFSLARLLYYQAAAEDDERWNTEPFESTYTELHEGEVIGINAEMLRTSFRLCFGILDKIARGVCDLFNLAGPGECVSFLSFWKKPQPRDAKQSSRWDVVNALKNPALVALYSQATDLDSTRGEWAEFKCWRNALEHTLLVLTAGGKTESLGPLVGKSGLEGRLVIDADVFRDHTLRLLQFTASAIFSFVFCVRHEGAKLSTGEGTRITLDRKPIGPE